MTKKSNYTFILKTTVIKYHKLQNSILSLFLFLTIIVYTQSCKAQVLKANAGFLIKAQIQLGNQNQGFKIGAYGTGAIHYGDVAVESGIALYSGYFFKKHTVKTAGFNYGYDAFLLAGIGNNTNLLASSFIEDGPLLAILNNEQRFYGLGFGFEKEFLPRKLSAFNQKLGKLLMRFSSGNHSINVQFKNDFRGGKVFNGEGTDFGATGMFQISYSQILNPLEIYHIGFGVSLFTPSQDYSKTPNNSINSDDGSKNVWHTKPPYNQLFYSNLYGFGGYQNNNFSTFIKSGVNSQKLGAYIQNTLHDGFGLNPRFPWDVAAKDLLFIEISGSIFNTVTTND